MADPITVSVLTHRFEAIVQEMGEAMLRTAYSQILNSSRDFSTALCDRQARLVAQADHVPIHVGALGAMVGSAGLGERRLNALVEEYGAKTVTDAVDEILDGAERQARACVATWKDGVYRGESVLYEHGPRTTDIPTLASATKKH